MASKEEHTAHSHTGIASNSSPGISSNPSPGLATHNGQNSKSHRDRGCVKAQGRDYTKPRNFTNASPTSNPHRSGSIRSRPGRELYRPPWVWEGEGGEGGQDRGQDRDTRHHGQGHLYRTNSYLNPSAQEFAPLSPAPLTQSRSMDWGHHSMEERLGEFCQHDNIYLGSRPSMSTPRSSLTTPSLKKSHSMATTTEITRLDLSGLGPFTPELEATIRKAMEDPNRLSGRSLMELVRTIFNRVMENQAMAEPAARFCISIIEREKRETFLESFLNSCQEWFHERSSLLRSPASSPGRWAAFMCFLNEMYGLLKRRQLQLLTKYEGIPPKLVLLSLLAECCMTTLTGGLTLATENEVECLFLVLTHIGRDLNTETPGQMTLLLTCLRDSFLHTTAGSNVRKLLLQLIELQAADWQLPAQAVMYYYPGTSS